jgi:flagellar basal-body rod protein FlgG
MDPLLISAAGGMKARMDSLDVLANNIANSGTIGYKVDREFYGLYQDQIPVIENAWTDFSQGSLTQTRNPLTRRNHIYT